MAGLRSSEHIEARSAWILAGSPTPVTPKPSPSLTPRRRTPPRVLANAESVSRADFGRLVAEAFTSTPVASLPNFRSSATSCSAAASSTIPLTSGDLGRSYCLLGRSAELEALRGPGRFRPASQQTGPARRLLGRCAPPMAYLEWPSALAALTSPRPSRPAGEGRALEAVEGAPALHLNVRSARARATF